MKKTCRAFFYFLLFLLLSQYSEAKESVSYHWNEARGFSPFSFARKDAIKINNTSDSLLTDRFVFPSPVSDFSLSFMSRNINGNPAKSYSYHSAERDYKIRNTSWGFFLNSGSDTLVFNIKNIEKPTGIETIPAVEVRIFQNGLSNSFEISNSINPFDGYNIWNLICENGRIRLFAGNNGLKEIPGVMLSTDSVSGFGFFAGPGSFLEIKDIDLTLPSDEPDSSGIYDEEYISEKIQKSEDPLEGYWTLFDRDLEESLLKMGGDYTLACIREGDDYLFIYISGAKINSARWQPGDIKAILRETPFSGIYEVTWFDSQKEKIFHDIKAQQGEGETLTIQFPYHSSRLRLRKIP